MQIKVQPYTKSYFASCAVGLEEVLSKEIQAVGGKEVTLERGGVEFKGPMITAIQVILHSRTASRVYKKLYSTAIDTEKNVYDMSKKIPWDSIFNLDQTFKIKTIIGYGLQNYYPNSFKNSIYLSQLLKDGIVDVFRNKYKERPDVDTDRADVNMLLRIALANRNVRSAIAAVYLDLCGNPLHQRGYRINQGEAPVKENMAAGIIKLMDWNHEKEIFIDSMCGSGTFLIESALIKYDIPPSFIKVQKLKKYPEYKHWAFLGFKMFLDDNKLRELYNNELELCREKIDIGFEKIRNGEQKIFGFDINTEVVKSCIENTESVNMNKAIKVKQIDSSTLKWETEEKGLIFCNPPYGDRLGDVEKLEILYRNYGENLKNNFKGFKAYVFTGNPTLKDSLILEPSRKFPLFNGPIECRLLKYDIY
ncbi:MAG: THUMP domain-containing protein [bacterium]